MKRGEAPCDGPGDRSVPARSHAELLPPGDTDAPARPNAVTGSDGRGEKEPVSLGAKEAVLPLPLSVSAPPSTSGRQDTRRGANVDNDLRVPTAAPNRSRSQRRPYSAGAARPESQRLVVSSKSGTVLHSPQAARSLCREPSQHDLMVEGATAERASHIAHCSRAREESREVAGASQRRHDMKVDAMVRVCSARHRLAAVTAFLHKHTRHPRCTAASKRPTTQNAQRAASA